MESLYNRYEVPLLSHGIYLCVTIARTEKCSSLRYRWQTYKIQERMLLVKKFAFIYPRFVIFQYRIAALEAIMAMMQVHDDSILVDIVLKAQVADVVALLLPGVTTGLLDVALNMDIQSHKVTLVKRLFFLVF